HTPAALLSGGVDLKSLYDLENEYSADGLSVVELTQTDYHTGEIIWHQHNTDISSRLTAILDKTIMSHACDRFRTAKGMLEVLKSDSTPITPIASPTLPPPQNMGIVPPLASPPTMELTRPLDYPHNNNKKIILSSLMIGSLIGISTVVGFFATQSPREDMPPKLIPSTVSRPSAEQALINYYQRLNQDQYSTAWNILSPEFRDNPKLHPKGYNSYTDWWTKVEQVEILSTKLVSVKLQQATVDTQLEYQLKSGRVINQSLRFYFVWDDASSSWLVDEVERLNF
ncbi:MAG: hypothetical protein F6K10_13650, partial [Moorea sp. SIO2B7]|nr:hypothetical protein [Moorena sp. SIO2B7]